MINAVLFDLDGTLLDTAPDIASTLNKLRFEFGQQPALPLKTIRRLVSLGSKRMVKEFIGIAENDSRFEEVRERFFALYEQHLADETTFFPGVDQLLLQLEKYNIPWGIVTNKLTRHAVILLKALDLYQRPHCIVYGDTLTKYKPDPEPILHACQLLQQKPENCLYLGDADVDVIASKAAGTKTLVALYGYINTKKEAYSWQADGYITKPIELLDWIFAQ